MALPPLIRPTVNAQPTLGTAYWFLQLRWLAAIGQLATLAAVVWVLRLEIAVTELLLLIGMTSATNVIYGLWLSRLFRAGLETKDDLPRAFVIPGLMLADVCVLTAMLYFSAGIANPFALFYFVNIAIAGAIVSPRWAWTVWALSVAGVTLLLVRSVPIAALSGSSLQAVEPGPGHPQWTIPKLGFLVSFATCSGVITYFITILTGELRQREQALQEAEDARVRNRQLEGLATLAAGAAHELASPLSTIAVVAKELSRTLERIDAPDSTQQDALLIRAELDQCRVILDRMTSAAGEAAGERLRPISAEAFLVECTLGVRPPARVQSEIAPQVAQVTNLLPVQAAAQAIRNLLQNAIDASRPDTDVLLRIDLTTDGQWRVRVEDHGEGMSSDVLERIGQPFFTTKEPGRGMGLGLYLTENVIRRLNGQLRFESVPGQGTTAEVLLPTER